MSHVKRSHYSDEHPSSTWLRWPDEILLIVFSKLDLKSLINCMQVNQHWRDVGGYYCQHNKLWEKLIEEVVDNSFLKFKEKSTLDMQDLFHNALQWYNIQHSKISFNFKLPSVTPVDNMCIQEDNLIILSNYYIQYCDVNNKLNPKKTFQGYCKEYVETYAFSAEIGSPFKDDKNCGVTVLLKNKLHKSDCQCFKKDKISPFNGRAHVIKAHLNTCYVVDTSNNLMAFQADYCQWNKIFLAKYYGHPASIYCINVHKDNVYVLLKKGDVLKVDMECKQFVQTFLFYPLFLNLFYSQGVYNKPIMFHKCSILFSVFSTDKMQISPADKNNQVTVVCPSMLCAVEHGPVLIVGYKAGKIDIFLTKKMLNHITTPELTFSMIEYVKNDINLFMDLDVKGLDIYEGNKGHHLFVLTTSSIFEFILSVDYRLSVFELAF